MDVAINYTIENIAAITNGKIILPRNPLDRQKTETQPAHLLLDSRKLLFPQSTIFFALNSPHRRGTEYIKSLYEKEVQNFIIDDKKLDVSL